MTDTRVFEIRPENRFKLTDIFISWYSNRQPQWGYGGLSHLVYKRTYSRPLTQDQLHTRVRIGLVSSVEDAIVNQSMAVLGGDPRGNTEEFWETLQRVVEGTYSILCQQVRSYHQVWDPERAQKDAQEMFVRMWEFKWLPPGRGLWGMGTEALEMKGGAILNNCGFVSTENLHKDFAEPFCALMDLLMLGVGMGFDTRGENTVRIVENLRVSESETFVVQDSREGWVEALRAVLDSFVNKRQLPGRFDYSQIRPMGAPLRTFSGTSSGPEPLRQLVNTTINYLLTRRGHFINSTDIVDIANRVGVCVVSGNIRRSAEIAIGDARDEEFVALKDPTSLRKLESIASNMGLSFEARAEASRQIELHPLNTHRWASNNSVLCKLGANYFSLAKRTVANGEPGYAWMETITTRGRMADPPDTKDSKAKGFNPCAEQVLWDNELCCLVETFPTHHKTLEDFKRTLKFAYLYAKVVTCIPTHRPQTNAVMNRNRRIGTSMAGVFGMVDSFGVQESIRWWNEGYQYIRELDQDYSGWMGVPESIRVTSIKPGGTVPLLAGVEGGMKVPSAQYYFRTVRLSADSPYIKPLEEAGYRIEDALHEPNTKVVYFPVAGDTHATNAQGRTAKDVTLWEQAALAAALQRWWSDNMVSCTLQFQKHEAKDVERVIGMYEGQLKTMAFLPFDDHGYDQAPYIPITRLDYFEEEKRIKPLNLNQSQHEETDKYCEGDRCVVPNK